MGQTEGRDDTEAENGKNFTHLSRIPILESVISSFCNFRVQFLVHALTLIVCAYIYLSFSISITLAIVSH